jgi:GntR family transcriptional regulator, transcriptional repressor for pyruvate dehydrogenase complex
MTKPALALVYSTFARIACVQRTACDLLILRDSVERARALPAGEAWPHKAAAHAQFHCLLADATGTPAFALLARFISGSVQDMISVAGPAAEDMIIASRDRILSHLELRDGDGAAREMEDYLTQLHLAAFSERGVWTQMGTI